MSVIMDSVQTNNDPNISDLQELVKNLTVKNEQLEQQVRMHTNNTIQNETLENKENLNNVEVNSATIVRKSYFESVDIVKAADLSAAASDECW